MALYGGREPQFEPGTQWEYSNYGMILLGRVIEVTSGQSYHDYVRDHIFKTAGMSSTDNLPAENVEGLAEIGETPFCDACSTGVQTVWPNKIQHLSAFPE